MKPRALCFPEYRIAYFAIPKTACTSIKEAMLGLVGGPDTSQLSGRPLWAVVHDDSRWDMREEAPADWFRFAVVRNPWDRLVSNWVSSEWVLFPEGTPKRVETFAEFAVFAATQPNATVNHALRSQRSMFEPFPEHIYRFEDLPDVWTQMRRDMGLDLPDLKWRMTSYHGPYQCYYTPELRDIAAARYADDIAEWHYGF